LGTAVKVAAGGREVYKLKILEAQQTSGVGWTVINDIDDYTVILLTQVGLEDIKSIVDMLDAQLAHAAVRSSFIGGGDSGNSLALSLSGHDCE
jgi:hypothetical protein